MLEINQEILELLERGGTLVVPSAQRAAAVRLAYTSAQLRIARRVWKSPDVLPWSAWLERRIAIPWPTSLRSPTWKPRRLQERTASLAAGASAGEIYGDSACKVEIARLWSAIERSVDAINRAQADAAGKAA